MPRLSSLGIVLLGLALTSTPAAATLLFEGSLQSGDYGSGDKIDTFAPDHGGSPHVLGIVDSPEGVTYTTTEASGTSNALINWELASSDRLPFRTAGTVSFCLRADRGLQRNGWVLNDNYGFNGFNHGQSSFGSAFARRDNGTPADTSDDLWGLGFAAWHNNVWYFRPATQPGLAYGPWYRVGYTWGGATHKFEIWADGTLLSMDDRPEIVLPWGSSASATNVGLGDNHQRGYDGYGSAAGVSFKHARLWTGAQPLGDTAESCGVCGNGFVEAGEACDDGNTADADCCSSTCQLDASGTGCGPDTVACTIDACDGAGTCAHTPDAAACNDTNVCTNDACDASTGCTHVPQAGTCDDGDACTVDACEASVCEGVLASLTGLRCRVDEIPSACGSVLPKKLGKRFAAKVRSTQRLLATLERAAGKGNTKKVTVLRGRVAKGLAVALTWTQKAASATDPAKQISAACRTAIDGKVSEVRTVVGTLVI